MGQNFKGALEKGREGGKQGGIIGAAEGLRDGFKGVPEAEPPRMAGDATSSYRADKTGISSSRSRTVTSGREYRKLGKFK